MRRGVTLTETMVALVLVSTAALSIPPLLHGVNRVQQGIDLQRLAQSEAANLLEEVSRMPYEKITAESVRGLSLSEAVRRELPQAKVIAEVANQSGEPVGKKLSVEIQWLPGPGRKSPPCRLVTWVYPIPGAKR